jgi:23S rRNA G2445 N2-methylase RlmL
MENKKIYQTIAREINKKFGFNSEHKFDFCISNPPYQIATGGKNHNIYDKFYFVGAALCKQMSMIFLMGWQTSSGRASGSSEHYLIREDKHIKSLYNYLENGKDGHPVLFKTASTGGVNIIN